MKYYNLKIIFITLLASTFSANAFDVGVGIHLSSYNGNNSDYVELIKNMDLIPLDSITIGAMSKGCMANINQQILS